MNKADRCIGQRILGNLTVKYRAERSFFEYNPHVLKSGIQKYARRNEVKKGLWCLIEMDLFSLLEGEGSALDAYLQRFPKVARAKAKTRAKTIRTNMINRLVVMMSEEVNISAWWMPVKMKELYQQWVDNRGNVSSQKLLVDMYLYLTSQQMIRIISDLKSVYVLPPYYVKPNVINLTDRFILHEEPSRLGLVISRIFSPGPNRFNCSLEDILQIEN